MARKPVSVSQLNNYISRILQTDPLLGNISVVGEISNLKYHGSGHVYFTLKDQQASIRCFMPASYVSALRYELTDGMEITASGYVSVYERGGTYSLNVKNVEISGEGGLMAAYRALFEKLQKAGYFDPQHKKALPEFPGTVCVITSETGAAIQDILSILRGRNPLVRVIIYPCLVQGPDAAGAIASAIRHVNMRFPEVDVIITGRGGGSLEDLWAFNEEKVAEAIYGSTIPVISAVGHETDFTIADHVADRRAETPTAAAVMAVPDIRDLKYGMNTDLQFIHDRLKRLYETKALSMERFSPDMLTIMMKNIMERNRHQMQMSLQDLRQRTHSVLDQYRNELEKCRITLEAADPERIVQRGYAIIYDAEGKAVTGTEDVTTGDPVTIRLKNGRLTGTITDISEE